MVDASKDPVVGVITATLNAGKYLRESIESILNQTYRNFEILIIDGGSTDETLEIAESFPTVKTIPQKGTGLFDAWNQGIRTSDCELVAILDSDDTWEPTALADHVNALSRDANKLASIGHVRFFLGETESPPPGFKLSLLEGSHRAYMPGCFMGRRGIFDRIGYFETGWEVASDIIWFGKLKELRDEIHLLDRIVLNKRIHGGNFSYRSVDEGVYGRELLKLLHLKLQSRGG